MAYGTDVPNEREIARFTLIDYYEELERPSAPGARPRRAVELRPVEVGCVRESTRMPSDKDVQA